VGGNKTGGIVLKKESLKQIIAELRAEIKRLQEINKSLLELANSVIDDKELDKKIICPSCGRTWMVSSIDKCECGAYLNKDKDNF